MASSATCTASCSSFCGTWYWSLGCSSIRFSLLRFDAITRRVLSLLLASRARWAVFRLLAMAVRIWSLVLAQASRSASNRCRFASPDALMTRCIWRNASSLAVRSCSFKAFTTRRWTPARCAFRFSSIRCRSIPATPVSVTPSATADPTIRIAKSARASS